MSDETTVAAPVEAAAPVPETADAPVEAEATETTEATDAEEAPKAVDSRLVAALARKRARLRSESARLAEERAALERDRAAATEREQLAERLQQLAQRAAQGDDEALRALGIDYDQLTIRRLRAGTPEAKLEAMQQQLEAERAHRLERERAAQEAAVQQQAQAAMQSFVSLVQGGQYPEASIYDAQEIAQAGNQIADEMAASRGGRYPSFPEIAAELERRVAARNAHLRSKLGVPAAPVEPVRRKATPTLSNRDSAEKSTARPHLSEEERLAAIAKWVAQSGLSR